MENGRVWKIRHLYNCTPLRVPFFFVLIAVYKGYFLLFIGSISSISSIFVAFFALMGAFFCVYLRISKFCSTFAAKLSV